MLHGISIFHFPYLPFAFCVAYFSLVSVCFISNLPYPTNIFICWIVLHYFKMRIAFCFFILFASLSHSLSLSCALILSISLHFISSHSTVVYNLEPINSPFVVQRQKCVYFAKWVSSRRTHSICFLRFFSPCFCVSFFLCVLFVVGVFCLFVDAKCGTRLRGITYYSPSQGSSALTRTHFHETNRNS